MKKKDFNYDLPEDLIAQNPKEEREESRLLAYNKENKEVRHDQFKNIINYFNPGDCLVLNNTKVLPARLYGSRVNKEEKIEILLLQENKKDVWEVMVRPGKKARIGNKLIFGSGQLEGEILDITSIGTRLIKFNYKGDFFDLIYKIGEMPLPPYIKEKLQDKNRYQTVYSKHIGSAAAPTAGLHFTNELLKKLKNRGVEIAYITLHVGLGTFRPVKVDNIYEHKMHSEFYNVCQKEIDKINLARENSGKIIAVGTTSARTLESLEIKDNKLIAGKGWTDIFIYPGYKFKVVDNLITNFHLPESTLLMLVSALIGREETLETYKLAVKEKYMFFSFGDAMYIY